MPDKNSVLMQIRPPFIVSYSITTKCNLKCKHCYSDSLAHAAPDELSTEEAFRLMDDFAKWGIGLLVIDGGEPLCREDSLDIVKYASSKGIRTTIGSNGILIDEAMARKMLEAGVKAVAGSFYQPEHFPGHQYPRLQVLTIRELLEGKEAQYPHMAPSVTFKRSQRHRRDLQEQQRLV